MSFEDYEGELEVVLKENPVLTLDDLLEDISIQKVDIVKLIVNIKKCWEKYKRHHIICEILIDDKLEGDSNSSLNDHLFNKDITQAIQTGYRSIIYIADKNGFIITRKMTKSPIAFNNSTNLSKRLNKLVFHLAFNGMTIFIKGICYKSDNYLDSYADVIQFRNLLKISEYRELLKHFFLTRVQYDPLKNFFVYKKDTPKPWHELLNKNPKLLRTKPEERFQNELELFLREFCVDTVVTEFRNIFKERYDVWVSTNDDLVYIFEIKWLGKSLTTEGTIFDNYNASTRAVEGAVQLKDYIDKAEEYSQYLGILRIHCGILVIFDARLEMIDIEFPNEYKCPQIDLSQHFKIEKEKINASKLYKHNKQVLRKKSRH